MSMRRAWRWLIRGLTWPVEASDHALDCGPSRHFAYMLGKKLGKNSGSQPNEADFPKQWNSEHGLCEEGEELPDFFVAQTTQHHQMGSSPGELDESRVCL